MPPPLSSSRAILRRLLVIAVLAMTLAPAVSLPAQAGNCPFCNAVGPTWSQLREPAHVVALAEVTAREGKSGTLKLTDVVRGEHAPSPITLELSADVPVGTSVLLLGEPTSQADAKWRWTDIAMSRAAFAYLRDAPDLRHTPAQRLAYFVPYLEAADPRIAEDAYLEFAHAAYSDVATVKESFNSEKLRSWIEASEVPAARKAFYALALALAGTTDAERAGNLEFLHGLLAHPGDDFQPGLDGVMGALLLTEKSAALATIRERFLANPDSANGHVRHALTAIRFYDEFGSNPDADELAAAVSCLLSRPAFATEVITDLTRWERWELLDQIVALFEKPEYDATTKRAVIAYLLTCDSAESAEHLERLRQLDPEFVNSAEERFLLFGGIR